MSALGRQVLADIDRREDAIWEAYQYVDYLGLEGPREHEGVTAFCERISGALRERGMLIEAHEALRGRRWDATSNTGERQRIGDVDSVLTGVAGALAAALHGAQPAPDGIHQVGDDIARGVVATNRDPASEALGAMFDLLGPDGTMDFLDGGRRR